MCRKDNPSTCRLLLAIPLLSAATVVTPVRGGEDAPNAPAALAPIVVEGARIHDPATAILQREDNTKGPFTDGGDLLKAFPGISAGRMGGHGIEPVIRGQSRTRLNILLDGAAVHGGCPNRMDPPTSYGASETYDQITVIKGVQSVEHGGGGSGGTVLFQRRAPEFIGDDRLRGRISAGYRGNQAVKESSLDVATGSPAGFLRGIINYSDGQNYRDGDGNEVRAAYTEKAGNLTLGWTPKDDSLLEFSYEANRADDVLYAGAGMDAPYTRNDTFRFKADHALNAGFLRGLHARLSHSAVEHLMDNYTHRTPTGMYMRAPSDSDTLTGHLDLEFATGPAEGKLGVDYRQNQRTATRYTGAAGNVNTIQSYLWPDVTIRSSGLFGEMALPLDDDRLLKLGARYDHMRAHAGKTGASTSAMNPDGLYTAYYGGASNTHTEDNVGGFIRLEQEFMDGRGLAYATASRALRTADATERYMASNSGAADGRWVGNPFLDPEAHHQLEIGAQISRAKWNLDVGVYYNDVSDYILRTRTHITGNNATIYRNVDATLFGGEASFTYHWSNALRSGVTLAYVHGENDTDNMPLAQMPPLEAGLTVDYARGEWDVGAKLRLVARQMRVDDDENTGSGLDIGDTAGFQTLDIFGSWRPGKDWKVKFGIDNLLDQHFAEHLNRGNTFDVEQTRINEPGRSVWVTADMEF